MSNIPNDKRDMRFGSAFSINDPEIQNFIDSLNIDSRNIFNQDNVIDKFCDEYKNWIETTKFNTFIGLDLYKYAVYSNGTTQGFDHFYIKNHKRRFRCFKGEYLYHQVAWKRFWNDWKFIEDEEIKENDAVIISLPFADTGSRHIRHDEILDTCDRLDVPVLIDCAYFGICRDIEFNFNHKSITDITFSLSKVFPVAYSRIGMRLTKEDNDDLMFVYQKISYANRIGAFIGSNLIKKFSPDYNTNKYKDRQMLICQKLNLSCSNTVLFGIANTGWEEYNRGGNTSRLSFHKFLHLNDDEFNKILKELKCQ